MLPQTTERELQIRQSLRVYAVGEEDLQFGDFSEDSRTIKDPAGLVRLLIERSEEGKPLACITQELEETGIPRAAIQQCVADLERLNLLERASTAPARYARQTSFFELSHDNFLPGSVYQDQLRESRVIVLGLNAAGSRVTQALLTAGVGEVIGVDEKLVQAEDIPHQNLYLSDSIGGRRTEMWRRSAQHLNSACAIQAVSSLSEAKNVEQISLCLVCDRDAVDFASALDSLRLAGVPYMVFGVEGGRGFVDPIYIPRRTPCPDCMGSAFFRQRSQGQCEDGPNMRLLQNAVADLALLQAFKYLSGFASPNNLSARLWMDLSGFRIEREELRPTDFCTACQELANEVFTLTPGEGGAKRMDGPLTEPDALLSSSSTARLEFYPLIDNTEGDERIMGHEATGCFVSMGNLEHKFLRLLRQGMTISTACRAFSAFFGICDPKVGLFLRTLIESGFVNNINGFPITRGPRGKKFFFNWITARRAAVVFSYPMLALYSALVVTALSIMFLHPQYRPRYRDIFFLQSFSLSLICNVFCGYLLAIPHELFHLLAARSVGCSSNISLSHRLYFPVFQTDVTNIWKVPQQKRNLVYLAGIIWDVSSGAIFVLLLWASDHGWFHLNHTVYGLLKASLYFLIFRLVWHCLFFMRTDIYYLVANLLRCRNLFEDARHYVRNHLARELPRIKPINMDHIPAREMRYVRLYALFFLVGTFMAIAAFSGVLVPVVLVLQGRTAAGLAGGFAGHKLTYLDSVTLLVITVGQLIWVGLAMLWERRKKRTVWR